MNAEVFRGPHCLAELAVSFDTDEVLFDAADFVSEGILTAASAAAVQRWIDEGRARGNLVVAAAIGLQRHEWFSFEAVERDRHRPSNDRVEVSVSGEIVTTTRGSARGAPAASR